MQIDRSPFLKLDHQTVLGYFKAAGSRDPDVLHSYMTTLTSLGRFPKLAGIYIMVVGALCTITILLSFIGIPALILGWWMWRRGKRNLEAIEAGYSEFLGHPSETVTELASMPTPPSKGGDRAMSFRSTALVLISAALCGPASAQVSVPAGFDVASFPFGGELDGIAVSTGGAYGNFVYVATNGAVKRVDPGTGAVSNFATGLATSGGRPSGLDFDSGVFGTGMLYVVENLGPVKSISPSAAVTTLSSGGSLFSPNGLAFAPVGSAFGEKLFVSNGAGGPSTVSQVDAAGVNSVFAAASNFAASPLGLDFPHAGSAFTPDLYVGVWFTDKLSRVNPSGTGTTFATGLGRVVNVAFNPKPAGPFGDFAYVTDTLNKRVHRVAPDGTVSPFASGFVFGTSGYDADLAFAPDGSALYVGSGSNLVAIRPCGSVDSYCTAKTNSQGCVPAIGWTGTPDVSGASDFVIRCDNVLELKAGILFYGFAANDAPFQGGFLCAKAPVTRTPPQLSVGSSCASTYSFDFDAHIRSGKDPSLTAFTEVFAQWWMRDPQSPSTTGLSNALRFRICP